MRFRGCVLALLVALTSCGGSDIALPSEGSALENWSAVRKALDDDRRELHLVFEDEVNLISTRALGEKYCLPLALHWGSNWTRHDGS